MHITPCALPFLWNKPLLKIAISTNILLGHRMLRVRMIVYLGLSPLGHCHTQGHN